MQGQLFEWGGVGIPSYFAFLVLGFLFATICGALWAKQIGQNPDVIVDLGLSMLVFGIVGARLLHVLADGYFWDYVHLCTDPSQVAWPLSERECERVLEPGFGSSWFGQTATSLGVWDAAEGVCRPAARDCFAWARFWAGGLTYYGGFLGASLAALFFLRKDRFPFWKAADMAGMFVPLGLLFGRLGCLLGGCCFGSPWDSPWAIRFPGGSPASQSQAQAGLLDSVRESSLFVHPTQIYEAAGSGLICLYLVLWLHGRKRYDGQVFLTFVGLYACLRYLIEIFRADERGGLLWMSTSQWLGVLLFLTAWGGHLILKRRSALNQSSPQ